VEFDCSENITFEKPETKKLWCEFFDTFYDGKRVNFWAQVRAKYKGFRNDTLEYIPPTRLKSEKFERSFSNETFFMKL
jgi:hypothetical protein